MRDVLQRECPDGVTLVRGRGLLNAVVIQPAADGRTAWDVCVSLHGARRAGQAHPRRHHPLRPAARHHGKRIARGLRPYCRRYPGFLSIGLHDLPYVCAGCPSLLAGWLP
ncbi:MAG: hypothetical protein WKG07_26030 [Hymenobacter sp.]